MLVPLTSKLLLQEIILLEITTTGTEVRKITADVETFMENPQSNDNRGIEEEVGVNREYITKQHLHKIIDGNYRGEGYQDTNFYSCVRLVVTSSQFLGLLVRIALVGFSFYVSASEKLGGNIQGKENIKKLIDLKLICHTYT